MFKALLWLVAMFALSMGARVTATEYVDKHIRRTKAATEDLKSGVRKVTVAPGEKAAAKVEKMRTNINAALDDGSWERKVRAVTLQEWKDRTIEKGAGRVGPGLEASKTVNVGKAERLLAAVDSAVATVDGMSNNTIDDSIERMISFTRAMHNAKGTI